MRRTDKRHHPWWSRRLAHLMLLHGGMNTHTMLDRIALGVATYVAGTIWFILVPLAILYTMVTP